MTTVRWAAHGNWSGPWIKGSHSYRPVETGTGWWDVLCYAVAYPEGCAYDSFVAYDGTAATLGLFQWTLTSGRLQRLLEQCRLARPSVFASTVGALLLDRRVVLADGEFRRNGRTMTPIELRGTFTPPNGRTPKTGAAWLQAKKAAEAFHLLMLDPGLEVVQARFFQDELRREASCKRPWLAGKRIEDVLYPDGWPGPGDAPEHPHDACRAMFWSFWQNSPRKAERYLCLVDRKISLRKDPCGFTARLSRLFAHSTFGNWGLAKAKAGGRAARYTKVANCINGLMGRCTLLRNP